MCKKQQSPPHSGTFILRLHLCLTYVLLREIHFKKKQSDGGKTASLLKSAKLLGLKLSD